MRSTRKRRRTGGTETPPERRARRAPRPRCPQGDRVGHRTRGRSRQPTWRTPLRPTRRVNSITLPSGITIPDAAGWLRRYCPEEWAYYDALPPTDPNRIEPLDVLATLGGELVHQRCRPHSCRASRHGRALRSAATQVRPRRRPTRCRAWFRRGTPPCRRKAPYVLISLATKTFHRKRPSLIPTLDTVVIEHYLRFLGRTDLIGASFGNSSGNCEREIWKICSGRSRSRRRCVPRLSARPRPAARRRGDRPWLASRWSGRHARRCACERTG